MQRDLLPSLFCGENHIQYRDETKGQRNVRIIYGWQEEHCIKPPDIPEPVFPDDGAELGSDGFLSFAGDGPDGKWVHRWMIITFR